MFLKQTLTIRLNTQGFTCQMHPRCYIINQISDPILKCSLMAINLFLVKSIVKTKITLDSCCKWFIRYHYSQVIGNVLSTSSNLQRQPSIGVLIKRCYENMQQIYKRAPLPKCALHLYWNRTSAWVFSCKFAAYFIDQE